MASSKRRQTQHAVHLISFCTFLVRPALLLFGFVSDGDLLIFGISWRLVNGNQRSLPSLPETFETFPSPMEQKMSLRGDGNKINKAPSSECSEH